MKSHYILILLLFTLGCLKENKSNEEKERELILNNKVSTIKEYVTPVNLGVPEKEYLKSVKLFNYQGFMFKEAGFSNDRKIEFISFYEYDKYFNVIQTKSVKADNSFISKIVRRYDDQNNLKELFRYEDPEGPYLYGSTYFYNDDKQLVESTWFWPTGLKAVGKYLYEGNKMVEYVNTDLNGKFFFKWIYKHDKKDNVIEAIQFQPDSLIITSKITYEYDKDNRLIKQTSYFKENIQYMATYQYDEKGFLSNKTEYSSIGKISAKYRYFYTSSKSVNHQNSDIEKQLLTKINATSFGFRPYFSKNYINKL